MLSNNQILERAAEIIQEQYATQSSPFTCITHSKNFLKHKLAGHKSEVFAVMFLTSQHELIEYREMFHGTIDTASVYPREVVRAVIETNAAAVILGHNHPSGDATPSMADRRITTKLKDILEVIDCRVLDHVVVGSIPVSFSEAGYL